MAGKAQLVGQLAGSLRDPANPANPSFSGKEEREEGREERGERGGGERMGREGYLLNK